MKARARRVGRISQTVQRKPQNMAFNSCGRNNKTSQRNYLFKMADWRLWLWGGQIVQAFGKDRVHSFDFVAIDDQVTACDMRSVSLKDGELDVAVFSLSIMESKLV